jgi:uridine phosphorylase
MNARFAGQALLFLFAAAVAVVLAATGLMDESAALGYVAALFVGAAGALLARAPLGLILIWTGAVMGALLQLTWQHGGSATAVAELTHRLTFYVISLAIASVVYLAGRFVLSRRERPVSWARKW